MKNVFTSAKFGLSLLKSRLLNQYKPFQVQFTVTNRCNLRCSYCYADYPNRSHNDLSTKDILRILDELAEIGTKRINLVGGEPLLRNDIGQIIQHIKNKNIECAMTTNGYFVARKLDDVRKLDLLCVSLDGNKESNDANRGKGSYEKALEAIKIAKANRIPLQVATVITKNNLNSIDYLLEEGKRIGFMIGFSTLINQSAGEIKIAPNDLPNDDEYRKVLKKIIRRKKEGYPVLFSYKSLQYALHWPLSFQIDKIINGEPDFKYIECNAGKYFAIIDTNGDIYPCPCLVGVMKPPNSLDMGVKKAFSCLKNHSCKTCHIPCQNEFNLMYSLDISVILNTFRNYKKYC